MFDNLRVLWPRPYERHFAPEYVNQLGELVDFQTAQPGSQGEDTRIVLRCYATARQAPVHMHRTELVHGKYPSSDPHTLSTVEDRPRAAEPNPCRNHKEQR